MAVCWYQPQLLKFNKTILTEDRASLIVGTKGSVFLCVVFSMETIMKKYMVVYHGANRCEYYDKVNDVYFEVQHLATPYSLFECVFNDKSDTKWVQVRLHLETTLVAV